MIYALKGDDRINIVKGTISDDIISVNYEGNVDLYQNDDWISLDKEQVKDLIKILKKCK